MTELEKIVIQLQTDLWHAHGLMFDRTEIHEKLLRDAPNCLLNESISLGRRMIGGDIETRDRFFVQARADWEQKIWDRKKGIK